MTFTPTRRLVPIFLHALAVASGAFAQPDRVTFPAAPTPWRPPVGIPAPSFGITDRPDAPPASWPQQEREGHYLVDRTAATATDDGNAYGSAARPRATIPTSLPAGSYVEVRGTGYALPVSVTFRLAGARGKPVFIVGIGQPDFTGPATGARVRLEGSYFIVEGLRFVNTRIVMGEGDTHFAAIRRCEVTGWKGGAGPALGLGSSRGATHVVYFNNYVHDNGRAEAEQESDTHGFHVTSRTASHHVWYVDNHVARNGGDSIQIGTARPGTDQWAHHIYVGRNLMHEDRENAVDIKAARDVIVSENEMYGYSRRSSSAGEAVVIHDDPERVWIVNNHVHRAARGIVSTGATGVYVVGNLVRSVHQAADSTSRSDGYAVLLRASSDVAVVNNTVWDADAGISQQGTTGASVVNNIVGGITRADGRHLSVETAAAARASTYSNNLFAGKVKILWAGRTVTSAAAFGATTAGTRAPAGEPRFAGAEPPGGFRLRSGSPGVDAGYDRGGEPHPVFLLFAHLYPDVPDGIARDLAGTPRPPTGARWDLGAYEGDAAAIGPRLR